MLTEDHIMDVDNPAFENATNGGSPELSWNTFLSRTSVSSLSTAAFSRHGQDRLSYGLENVFETVRNLSLRYTPYNAIDRLGLVGEGETFLVERCQVKEKAMAIKFLKFNGSADENLFRRRIKSIILELRIMRHEPLRVHPSIPKVLGYGWTTEGPHTTPYLLMEYAPYGTFREYLRTHGTTLSRRQKEILLGDVSSAIEALHVCNIIHGDIKLDNVLLFHSWDRPAKAIAKISDFGHSLVVPGPGQRDGSWHVEYGGTKIYNAPETRNQEIYPIEPLDLHKCDIWAFGLLIWETFLNGDVFYNHMAADCRDADREIISDMNQILETAKRSIPFGRYQLCGNLIRMVLHGTLQADPSKRLDSISHLPFLSQWHAEYESIESHFALHLGSSEYSYEMFRLDNSREIQWNHEVQITQRLRQAFSRPESRHMNGVWQLALCHFLGFGTSPNQQQAIQLSSRAAELGHPIAALFGSAMNSCHSASTTIDRQPYKDSISALLHKSKIGDERCQLMKAFAETHDQAALGNMLAICERLIATSDDGSSILHFLFMASSSKSHMALTTLLRSKNDLAIDHPATTILTVHQQWPLRLSGSPLVFAISVNCLRTVKLLLSLGADPCAPAFDSGQFPPLDSRSGWTPLHVAVQYHCYDILEELLKGSSQRLQKSPVPLACALAYSTPLERAAMHGNQALLALDKTVSAITKLQSMGTPAPNGETALTRAIDFHDATVISAILKADSDLVHIPMIDPRDPSVFNFPVHWAAQIGARRDSPEAINGLELVGAIGGLADRSGITHRDSAGRTALHLAATGIFSRASEWTLNVSPGMVSARDQKGRFPLHCCQSSEICDFLISKGAGINNVDDKGQTALHVASATRSVDFMRCLLKHKADAGAKDHQGQTPLHIAVGTGSFDSTVLLLEEGHAPVNTANRIGDTPIHVATMLNRHRILAALLKNGADARRSNGREKTAFDIAKSQKTPQSIVTLDILQGLHIVQGHGRFGLNDGAGGDFIRRLIEEENGYHDQEPDPSLIEIQQYEDAAPAPAYEEEDVTANSTRMRLLRTGPTPRSPIYLQGVHDPIRVGEKEEEEEEATPNRPRVVQPRHVGQYIFKMSMTLYALKRKMKRKMKRSPRETAYDLLERPRPHTTPRNISSI